MGVLGMKPKQKGAGFPKKISWIEDLLDEVTDTGLAIVTSALRVLAEKMVNVIEILNEDLIDAIEMAVMTG